MPPILASLRISRRRTCQEAFFDVLQVIHFLVAMCFLWAGIVEFVKNPPYFDAYGDASVRSDLPQGLFQTDPRNINREQALRLMDFPILGMLLAYFGVCWWLKFRGLAWLLTLCMTLVLVFFFIVNFWAVNVFDWRYYSPRMRGLEVQVFSITLSITTTFVVLFYKRRKMPFKFKPTLPIRPFGKIHVFCNFAAMFVIVYLCLMIWFSKLYVSWSCFKDFEEVLQLCSGTSMVQCYPCDTCNSDGLRECVKEEHKMFHCQNVREEKGAVCLFNYNLSVFVFLTVFAYVGGLVVFLSSLFKIVLHYSLRAIFLFIHWYHVKLTSREGHRMDLDLPQMPGEENYCALYASIQEPFLYVEGAGQNEAEVTDDSLHCHLNSSIDTCRIADDGDSIVDVLT